MNFYTFLNLYLACMISFQNNHIATLDTHHIRASHDMKIRIFKIYNIFMIWNIQNGYLTVLGALMIAHIINIYLKLGAVGYHIMCLSRY